MFPTVSMRLECNAAIGTPLGHSDANHVTPPSVSRLPHDNTIDNTVTICCVNTIHTNTHGNLKQQCAAQGSTYTLEYAVDFPGHLLQLGGGQSQ